MTKTRRNNEQKQANRNNFANHNYDSFANTIISNPIAKPQYTTQEHDYTHQIQKPVSQSLLISEKRKSLPHRTENQKMKIQPSDNLQEVNHTILKMKIILTKNNNNTTLTNKKR